MSRRSRAVLAGIVAAALALGVAELLAGIVDGVPSLVAAVGAAFVPLVPPALKDWAIRLFGTTDKAVLEATVVAGTLALGGVAGGAAARRLASGAGIAMALAVFGIVVVIIDPLAQPVPAVLVVLVALGAGVVALWWLLARVAPSADGSDGDGAPTAASPAGEAEAATRATPERRPAPAAASRRDFLLAAAGVATAAVVTGWVGRALVRGPDSAAREAVTLPRARASIAPPDPANRLGVEGLTPIVVPNDEFYRIDVNLGVPQVDTAGWSLRIHGMVDREVELTYDELTAMDVVEEYVTLSCVSNEVGGNLVGNAAWLGVPLGALLERAGVQDGATQIVGRSVDGWTAGFPTELATDGRVAMVAVGMNGEPLPAAHGFPARLVVAGLYGYVSATKWLSEIELTTLEAFDAYWVPRGWAKRAPIKTQSRIDVPRGGASVDASADVVAAGVAWAPNVGLSAVELQVDDGPWQACELTEPLSEAAWIQWRRPLRLAPGDHVLRVRATDATGEVQAAEESPPRPDGATGYHTIRVAAS